VAAQLRALESITAGEHEPDVLNEQSARVIHVDCY